MTMSTQEPRVLVISSNPFSRTRNNGKTLASFFSSFQSKNIAQLYFEAAYPTEPQFSQYFRVTDADVLSALLGRQSACGGQINNSANIQYSIGQRHIPSWISGSNIARLFRDVVWRMGKWKSADLLEWLDRFEPQIVFLCGGDVGFAYDIASFVAERFNSRKIIFVTDDYVLLRASLNAMWWLRRAYCLRKMKQFVNASDLFLTISEKMRLEYQHLFNKDSYVVVNMTESLRDEIAGVSAPDVIRCVYAGGLHHNRYKTLREVGESISVYNSTVRTSNRVFLEIYSTQSPTKKHLNHMQVPGASKFYGALDSARLKRILNECDVLLYVEAFDRASQAATRLSMSTKVPEYLSLGKPILVVGPSVLASIEYLRDVAHCITNQSEISRGVQYFFENRAMWAEFSTNARQKYETNHRRDYVVGRFRSIILDLVR